MVYFTIERQNVQRFIRAASRARWACIIPLSPQPVPATGNDTSLSALGWFLPLKDDGGGRY
jgi:hypothetical protein